MSSIRDGLVASTVTNESNHCGLPRPLLPPEAAKNSPLEMAIIRHAGARLRAVRCVRQPATMRSLSVTARRQGGGHGNESQFDPPSGWLWGIKPGEKPEAEGWEWPMYLFGGSLLITGIALAFKPDTR